MPEALVAAYSGVHPCTLTNAFRIRNLLLRDAGCDREDSISVTKLRKGQEGCMGKRGVPIVALVLLLSAFTPNALADVAIYDFSVPQFLLGQSTPFLEKTPNIGPSNFLATFTANTSSYAVVNSAGRWPLFNGQALQSQCFCAQTLTVNVNTPVYGVSVHFASISFGFSLTLTTSSGTVTSTYGPSGGSLYFLSATPFTSIQLGTGIFAIDNLALSTDPPTPREAALLLTGDVNQLVQAGTLTQDQADGLTDKVAAVITTIDSGNTVATCNQLQAFINQVNAFVRSRKLTADQGQRLIGAAQNIGGRIGC
jgi:hypothetical protein